MLIPCGDMDEDRAPGLGDFDQGRVGGKPEIEVITGGTWVSVVVPECLVTSTRGQVKFRHSDDPQWFDLFWNYAQGTIG